jgi:hypothetical protein
MAEGVAATIFAPLLEISITLHSAIARSCTFIHAVKWRPVELLARNVLLALALGKQAQL